MDAPPPPPPPTGPTYEDLSSAAHLPELDVLPRSAARKFLTPVKRINDGTDVARFHSTRAYRDICTFILQLNRAVCPRLPKNQSEPLVFTLAAPRQDPGIVKRLQSLLSRVEAIIGEVPPSTGPRRFGNVSFRTWHQLLEQRIDGLLKEHLPWHVIDYSMDSNPGTEYPTAWNELREYFVGGFGSPSRLDYGTGHELSFIAFLGCLWKLGAFTNPEFDLPSIGEDRRPGAVERSIVLGVIEPYLAVVRKLILTYTLEPAGSHGVWGLDDHSFVPYVFGSAQLTRPIRDETEPMPLEGSCPGAPQPKSIVNPDMVEKYRTENMYFAAIGFINDVKTGPFWEHSPTLYDISGVKDGWGKINKGMIKMFNAEVLGKFPVVQHFPFGSLFEWERDPSAPDAATSKVHIASQPVAGPGDAGGATTFPAHAHGAGGAGARGMPPTVTVAPWLSRVPESVAPGGGASSAGTSDQWVHTPTRAPWATGERK
ncbi:putative serine threonine-protein phosphatase [Rhypophila sp. PSN 637]